METVFQKKLKLKKPKKTNKMRENVLNQFV